MIKAWSVILGVGLVILGIVGISSMGVPAWIGWVDIGGGLLSMAVGTSLIARPPKAAWAGWPMFMAAGLYAVWLIQLIGYTARWMAWWNFGFACVYLLGALGYLGVRKPGVRPEHAEPPVERERPEDRFRRTG